jgi:hypothetical protein
MSSFHYMWKHLMGKPQFKQFEANDEWQNIRYALEKKYHMHDAKSYRKNRCYISGFRITLDGSEIKLFDTTLIAPGDILVLSRKPMQFESMPFIPIKFRKSTHDMNDTKMALRNEEAKMLDVINSAQETSLLYHPSLDDEIYYPLQKLTKNSSDSLIPSNGPHVTTNQRKRPAGIPKKQLRLAKTEEEIKHAMIDKDGKLVIRK